MADLILFYPSVMWLACLLFYLSTTTTSSMPNNPTSQQKAITRDHDAYYVLSSHDNDYLSTVTSLACIGARVVLNFGIVWLQLQTCALFFSVGCGLFEDKVVNVWFSLSVLVKLRERCRSPRISALILAVTGALKLTSVLDLLRRP